MERKMKKIYIEVSEDMYSDAKEVGFFETADYIRSELKTWLRAQLEHKHENR